jgi:hypothetical protein
MDIKHSGPKLSVEEAWLTMLCMLIYVLDLFDGGGRLNLYSPRSCMLFVNGADDDATPCALSRGCCEINGTAVNSDC